MGRQELYSKHLLSDYYFRYISYPKPIIISDLKPLEDEYGFPYTIEGENISYY
jgi:hypothetical protein